MKAISQKHLNSRINRQWINLASKIGHRVEAGAVPANIATMMPHVAATYLAERQQFDHRPSFLDVANRTGAAASKELMSEAGNADLVNFIIFVAKVLDLYQDKADVTLQELASCADEF
jgi:hypothetical protein